MNTEFRLFPEQASTTAPQVDAVTCYLTAVTLFFIVLIASLIVFFAIKYRRGSKVDRSNSEISYKLEIVWIGFPSLLLIGMFVWGASVYFRLARPPAGAMEIHVVGKQWMWYFQHPNGNSEIDELHVPKGRPVRLSMISQDVI